MTREYYKKKAGLGVDLKDRRRLRRSIHQKEERDKNFLLRRGVEVEENDLSSVDHESLSLPKKQNTKLSKVVRPPLKSVKNEDAKKTSRLEMLKKWKEEKEMKRKVEQMNKKKGNFKVFKVVPEKAPSWGSAKSKVTAFPVKSVTSQQATKAPPKPKPAVVPARRSTRIASRVDSNMKPILSKAVKHSSTSLQTNVSTVTQHPPNVKVFRGSSQTTGNKRLTGKPTSKKAGDHNAGGFTFRMELPVKLKTVTGAKKGDKPVYSFPPAPKTKVAKTTNLIKAQNKTNLSKQTAIKTNTKIGNSKLPSMLAKTAPFEDMKKEVLRRSPRKPLTLRLPTPCKLKKPEFKEDLHISPAKKPKLSDNCDFTEDSKVTVDKAETKQPVVSGLPTSEEMQVSNQDQVQNKKEECIQENKKSSEMDEVPEEKSALKEETEENLVEMEEPAVSKEDRDGAAHYEKLMHDEISRLQELCTSWEDMCTSDHLSDEIRGEIRSAIGKAQLLVNQRFIKQFSGLIQKCADGSGEQKIHATDLQGFWEMVYYQVEDVNQMFSKLNELKANNWIRKEQETKKVKKVVKKKAAAADPNKNKDDKRKAARERLAAIKAAMKAKNIQKSESVVFDGGFFKVESPVKVITPHCAAGTPNKGTPSLRKNLVMKSANSTPVRPENKTLHQVKVLEKLSPMMRKSPRYSDSPLTKVSFPPEKTATPTRSSKRLSEAPIAAKLPVTTTPPEFNLVPSSLFSLERNTNGSLCKSSLPGSATTRIVNQFKDLGLNSATSSASRKRTRNRENTPLARKEEMVTSLRDLGFSPLVLSQKKETRTRRKSSRLGKENDNDLAAYLVPSLPVVDLNDQAEDSMQTEPADQLAHLGVRDKRTSILGDMSAYLMSSIPDEECTSPEQNARSPLKEKNISNFDSPLNLSKDLSKDVMSPLGDLCSPSTFKPRRSMRIRPGRVSAFTPPRRSMLCVNVEGDLMSFD